ncbi:MAG: hypothetical protein K0S32_4076 [Bacteroidetes bacterium]|jgi:hypothetical protein|nr:hypothetical protein [Bacteroidota bacterium]
MKRLFPPILVQRIIAKTFFPDLELNFIAMKKILLLVFGVSCFWGMSQNVGINATGAAPAASAMLDVTSTTSGMLIPRMTTAQRTAIAAPANGLMVFDTNLNCVYMYLTSTATWRSMCDSYGPYYVETTTLFNPGASTLLKTQVVTTSATTDRVLIEAEFDFAKNATASYVALALYRNGVEIHEVAKYGTANADNSIKLTWVDIPGTAAAQTYTIRYYMGAGGLLSNYGSNIVALVKPQ